MAFTHTSPTAESRAPEVPEVTQQSNKCAQLQLEINPLHGDKTNWD